MCNGIELESERALALLGPLLDWLADESIQSGRMWEFSVHFQYVKFGAHTLS